MNPKKLFLIVLLFLFSSLACVAQTNGRTSIISVKNTEQVIKSSPAYGELILQKTEVIAELADLVVEYTEEYPKVKELRTQLALINKEINRLMSVNPAETSKLSQALGKLMLRKVEVEMAYEKIQKQYTEDHPDVKQAKRKVDLFDAAIKDILQ